MSRVDEALAEARDGVDRLTPEQAWAELRAGALVIDRTVLEWRLDPTSPARVQEACGPDLRVVVICRQGYSSSFAVESLRRIGLARATDVVGGVEAWLAAGLPLSTCPADVRD